MAQIPKTVHVEPGSELDRALRDAGETPVELEQRGVRYRVTRIGPRAEGREIVLADERDIWAGYDPERVRQGLRGSSGLLREVDHDQLQRDLTEQRGQDSRGRTA